MGRFADKIRSGAFAVTTKLTPPKGIDLAELFVGATANPGAARTIRGVRNLCAGVHLMMLGWESHVPEILKASGVRA